MLNNEDSFIVSSDQFFNNTVIALVVANLADDVLEITAIPLGCLHLSW
ncbi:MAG: hypothetical protein WKF36_12210 [Candidatus Nitrosocosmicus sp.]